MSVIIEEKQSVGLPVDARIEAMMATNVVTSPMKTKVSVIPIRNNAPFGAAPISGNLVSKATKLRLSY
jgi:hypothetical protein